MYLPISPQVTCAMAWLEATNALNEIKTRKANNVIIDIKNPCLVGSQDVNIINTVDNFLRGIEKPTSLNTVANTIFPQSLYSKHGSPEFYDVYERVYDRIKQPNEWGRYFHRMIYRISENGVPINQLRNLVEKLKSMVDGNRRYKNIYELDVDGLTQGISIYDPYKDGNRLRNRQCLSFMSFKLEKSNQLNLTAMYRNQYYVERLLGNLIGLARLMNFIGQEVAVDIGQLTVISTHAEVETPSGCTRNDINTLLRNCSRMKTNICANKISLHCD